MNLAIAVVLLDAVAVALAVQLGRVFHMGAMPSPISVRAFLLVLAVLGLFALGSLVNFYSAHDQLVLPSLIIALLLIKTARREP